MGEVRVTLAAVLREENSGAIVHWRALKSGLEIRLEIPRPERTVTPCVFVVLREMGCDVIEAVL